MRTALKVRPAEISTFNLKAAITFIRGEAIKVVIKPPENMKSAGVGRLLECHTLLQICRESIFGY